MLQQCQVWTRSRCARAPSEKSRKRSSSIEEVDTNFRKCAHIIIHTRVRIVDTWNQKKIQFWSLHTDLCILCENVWPPSLLFLSSSNNISDGFFSYSNRTQLFPRRYDTSVSHSHRCTKLLGDIVKTVPPRSTAITVLRKTAKRLPTNVRLDCLHYAMSLRTLLSC